MALATGTRLLQTGIENLKEDEDSTAYLFPTGAKGGEPGGKGKTKLHLIFSNTYQVTVRLRSQNQVTRVLIFFYKPRVFSVHTVLVHWYYTEFEYCSGINMGYCCLEN